MNREFKSAEVAAMLYRVAVELEVRVNDLSTILGNLQNTIQSLNQTENETDERSTAPDQG